MKTKIINLWQKLLSTYWFVPSLMAVGAIILALGMVVVDKRFGLRLLGSVGWFNLSEAEGVRDLLSTVAGAMITVTGVVFSIMVVALSLASQQFGPRILSNFMRDRGNQIVFGTVIATYIYCLLVLRSISTAASFVPHLSEVVALLLTLASLGALIYFIHHTAESIQAGRVIERVSSELARAIDRLFPAESAGRSDLPGELPDFDRKGHPVPVPEKGFLQAIATEGLLEFATRKEIVVRIEHRPGHFVIPGEDLATVWPWQRSEGQEFERLLQSYFIIDRQRTPEQDAEFLIDELVEMAVRSLSPGINDPFTAMGCIDHLSAALGKVAGRGLPEVYHFDDRKRLRVITWSTDFADLVDAAFDQIRQNVGHHATVHIRLLEAIGRVLGLCTREEQYRPLLAQSRLVLAAAERDLPAEADRDDVKKRWKDLVELVKRRFGVDLAATGPGKKV